MGADKVTPMMAQWLELKQQAGDALLFFRLGDFYELFEADAETAAPIMGVTLTSRATKGSSEKAPALCGIPYHSHQMYLKKLLDAGYRVAIAEQTEEPGPGKKLVRREIVQTLSPGIRFDQPTDEAHYCAVVTGTPQRWVLAAADVATGHVVMERGHDLESLQDWLRQLPVEDLRVPFKEKWDLEAKSQKAIHLLPQLEAEQKILEAFQLSCREDNPAKTKSEILALGSLIKCLQEAQSNRHFRLVLPQQFENSVWLNASTRRGLHLDRHQGKSLADHIDACKTAMGSRFLRHLLQHPSCSPAQIALQQALVAFFKNEVVLRQQLQQILSKVPDVHRLLRRRASPFQLYQLQQSLERLTSLLHLDRNEFDHPCWRAFMEKTQRLLNLSEELKRCLQWSEQPDEGWIAPYVDSTLDELRSLKNTSAQQLAHFELKLRDQLNIPNLKIKWHQTFGYVVEATASHRSKIPETVKIVQSLANATRFKWPELSELEEKILSLDQRIVEAEKAQIDRLTQIIQQNEALVLECLEELQVLDCYQGLAEISQRQHWTTPRSETSGLQVLKLQHAKHPFFGDDFIPLTVELTQHETQVILLSGPNMAGKSTLLRVAALFAILHQIGSDVPAEAAELSIFDRIVCRMGAFDDLNQGASTFFIEMREVAQMLQTATPNSLLLFDEVGRGTSTFDGMSLAWAITEEVHELRCLSIVATHYLELAALEQECARLKNFHVGVKESKGELIFTRQLMRGPASQSYGVQVARLAAVPASVLRRAQNKLKEFESQRKTPKPLKKVEAVHEQISLRF